MTDAVLTLQRNILDLLVEVPPGSDALASVRKLSLLAGYAAAVDDLLLLGSMASITPVDHEPTWGQNERPEDADLPDAPTIL